MSRKVNYFESENIAPTDYTTCNVCIPVRYVPMLISAIETRKARSFWTTDDNYARGLQVLEETQIMLLTGCNESVVRTLAMIMGYPPDVELDPLYGTPLITGEGVNLKEFRYDFWYGSRIPGDQLQSIKENTLATANDVRKGLIVTEGEEDKALLQKLLDII